MRRLPHERGRWRIEVSHPFAKNANGWGTGHLRCDWLGSFQPYLDRASPVLPLTCGCCGPGGCGRFALAGEVGGETLSTGADLVGEAGQDGLAEGFFRLAVDFLAGAFEHDGGAGLGERLLGEDEQGAAGAVGGLAEAKPGGEGDAATVFGRGGGEVEDNSGESAGLEEEVGGAEGLVETGPRFGGQCRSLAADPEELAEGYAVGGCGFGVEGVVSVYPGADSVFLGAGGEEGEGKAGAARGHGAGDFADGADGQAAFEESIDRGDAGGGGFTDGARNGSERSWKAAFEGVLDLVAEGGG